MKDFGRWFNDFTLPSETPQEEEMLPEGVYLMNGRPHAQCRGCERDCDVSEFIDDNPRPDFLSWYNGCGPYCCP